MPFEYNGLSAASAFGKHPLSVKQYIVYAIVLECGVEFFAFASWTQFLFIMLLLIDGYNVLHQSGLLGKGRGGAWLERGRKRLLDLMKESLDPSLLCKTHIVFDAHSSHSIATEITHYQEIKVHFSLGYENADALIEKLIREHSAPKSLTVVSSDHRIQRCAKAHRCRIYDSTIWLDEIARRKASGPGKTSAISSPREHVAESRLSNVEVELWLKEFGILQNTESPFDPDNAPLKIPGDEEKITTAKPRRKTKSTSKARSTKAASKPKTTDQRASGAEGAPTKKREPKREPKRDLPRERKRAARPLPDGFQFPEINDQLAD